MYATPRPDTNQLRDRLVPELVDSTVAVRREPDAFVVALAGEHDLATCDAVRAALAPLDGDLLVDLSGCTFIDASVLGVLIAKKDELAAVARTLEVLVPEDNRPITRTLAIPCIREQLYGGAPRLPQEVRGIRL